MNNNYLTTPINPDRKKTNTLQEQTSHDLSIEDSSEVDSLTEIFNIIKSELDLIGNIII